MTFSVLIVEVFCSHHNVKTQKHVSCHLSFYTSLLVDLILIFPINSKRFEVAKIIIAVRIIYPENLVGKVRGGRKFRLRIDNISKLKSQRKVHLFHKSIILKDVKECPRRLVLKLHKNQT